MKDFEKYLIAVLLFLLGAWVNGIVVPIIRRKMVRADDADRKTFAEVVKRVDDSQHQLMQRLSEDRNSATKQFGTLWDQAKEVDRRLTRLETHHETNHPGQRIGA